MQNSNIVLFSDTDCDLSYEQIQKFNINLIYMPVYIDGEEYEIDLKNKGDFEDFYKFLAEKKKPTTAAISKQNYIDAFSPFLKSGKDVLYVHFSRGLSATFEQMDLAIAELKKLYPKNNVFCANTASVSSGAGTIVIQVAKLLEEGKTIKDAVKLVESLTKQTKALFIVDDLNHLKRGGRIGATTAVVGGIINVKPILSIDENGKLVKISKSIGIKKGLSNIFEEFTKTFAEIKNGEIYILNANAVKDAQYLYEKILAFVGNRAQINFVPVGPIVAAHCGMGTIGLIYHTKKS